MAARAAEGIGPDNENNIPPQIGGLPLLFGNIVKKGSTLPLPFCSQHPHRLKKGRAPLPFWFTPPRSEKKGAPLPFFPPPDPAQNHTALFRQGCYLGVGMPHRVSGSAWEMLLRVEGLLLRVLGLLLRVYGDAT